MKFLITILLMLFITPFVKAQDIIHSNFIHTLDSAGDEGTGEGGSISFSVGQLSYTTISTNHDIVFQGVQIPPPIMVTGLPFEKLSTIDISAYPNPATDYFILEIENYEDEDLNYEFYNLQGKLIESKPITNSKTRVSASNLQSAIYIVRISYKNSLIKTFQISKR